MVTKTFVQWALFDPPLGAYEQIFRLAYGASSDQEMDRGTLNLRLKGIGVDYQVEKEAISDPAPGNDPAPGSDAREFGRTPQIVKEQLEKELAARAPHPPENSQIPRPGAPILDPQAPRLPEQEGEDLLGKEYQEADPASGQPLAASREKDKIASEDAEIERQLLAEEAAKGSDNRKKR